MGFMVSYVSEWVSSIPQSGIREIFHESIKLKDVIHLEIGDPDFNTPEVIAEAIYKAMLDGYTHYTHNAGLIELRESISEYYARKYGIALNPEDNVVVSAGSSEGLSLSLLATLNPGDEVLIPDPGYPSYVPMIMCSRGRVTRYRVYEEKNFEVDPGEVLSRVTPKTKVIIVNNPHNPSGSVTPVNRLEEIVEYAYSKGVVVISDEVYENIVYDEASFTSLSVLANYDNVIIVNSLSKTFAMTGLRIGFVISRNKRLVEVMTRMQEGLIACAPTPIQVGAIKALSMFHELVPPMIREYRRRRDVLVSELSQIKGVSFVVPKGTFYMLVNVSKYTSDSRTFAKKLLHQNRVAVAPGIAFGPGGEGYIRISFATSTNNIVEGVKRINNFLTSEGR
jgi:aspartate/methionine/tyrosine aminotransferase